MTPKARWKSQPSRFFCITTNAVFAAALRSGSARDKTGNASIVERPIGDDPEALRALRPDLDIWDAYATIHLLMPDRTMNFGGEAVAEVLRSLNSTKWFAWSFAASIFGVRPFQSMLNVAYAILSDVRPLFGCESCGTRSPWMKPIGWMARSAKTLIGKCAHRSPTPHFTSFSPTGRAERPLEAPAT